jgi:hypothetical protein
MDPTLPADSVRDYILRGSKQPRRDPASGLASIPGAVPDAPGPVYQLDAYGSLSLLASERRGTPICGFPVRLALTPEGATVGLVLDRSPTRADTVALGSDGAWGFSVAQGGRTIAVHQGVWLSDTDLRYQTALLDHRGRSLGSPIPDRFRRFLENGWADEEPRYDQPYSLEVRTGDSSRTVIPAQFVGGDQSAGLGCFAANMAPDATRMTVDVLCDPEGPKAYLVNLETGTSTLLPAGTSARVWQHDSRAVLSVAVEDDQLDDIPPAARLRRHSRDGAQVATGLIADRGAYNPRITGDDAALVLDEADFYFTTCDTKVYPVANLSADGASAGTWDCNSGYYMGPQLPNLRSAVASAADGFSLAAPARALANRRAVRGPMRAQAN